jgi:hypothetical protein
MNPSPLADTRGIPPSARSGAPGTEQPLKEVLVELWENTEKLVRQEIQLARTELDVKTRKLKTEIVAAAIAGGLLLCGVLSLVAAIILLLALAIPAWAAALVVGVVAVGGGYALLQAKKPNPSELIPERTLQNLERDVQTFRESTK